MSHPSVIGRYKVLRLLGAGAMGEVFEVEDAELGRHVALKLLAADMSDQAHFRERFRREAVAMAQIRHPNVLQVFELGHSGQQPFITMELVEGGDCANYIEAGTLLPVSELARITQQSALGLAAAAERQLVHRDVKPANLLIHQGQVKVSDFGIARDVESTTTGLTQYGLVMGTPEYMAPEQAMGMPVDLRSDLYALGISVFQVATLHLPFVGEAGAVLQMQVDKALPDPRQFRPDLPDPFVKVLRRMTEKDPVKRYQTYDELCADLVPFMGTERPEFGIPGALVHADGPLAGRTIDLGEGDFVIGRQTDCNLVLDDPQASRRHALFVRDAQGMLVRDLGSRNGILVNGARVHSSRLNVGDVVQVGSSGFKVLAGKPSPQVRKSTTAPGLEEGIGDARVAWLSTLARAMVQANSQAEVSRATAQLFAQPGELVPARRMALFRWKDGRVTETPLHVARAAEDQVTPLTAAIGHVCTTGTPVYLRDATQDPKWQLHAGRVHALMVAPVLRGREVIGCLYADATGARDAENSDRLFFETLAHLLASALFR